MLTYVTVLLGSIILTIIILNMLIGGPKSGSRLSDWLPKVNSSQPVIIVVTLALLYFFGGTIKIWLADWLASSDPATILGLTSEQVARWLWLLVVIPLVLWLLYRVGMKTTLDVASWTVFIICMVGVVAVFTALLMSPDEKGLTATGGKCTTSKQAQAMIFYAGPKKINICSGNDNIIIRASNGIKIKSLTFSKTFRDKNEEILKGLRPYDFLVLQPPMSFKGSGGNTYLLSIKPGTAKNRYVNTWQKRGIRDLEVLVTGVFK